MSGLTRHVPNAAARTSPAPPHTSTTSAHRPSQRDQRKRRDASEVGRGTTALGLLPFGADQSPGGNRYGERKQRILEAHLETREQERCGLGDDDDPSSISRRNESSAVVFPRTTPAVFRLGGPGRLTT